MDISIIIPMTDRWSGETHGKDEYNSVSSLVKATVLSDHGHIEDRLDKVVQYLSKLTEMLYNTGVLSDFEVAKLTNVVDEWQTELPKNIIFKKV